MKLEQSKKKFQHCSDRLKYVQTIGRLFSSHSRSTQTGSHCPHALGEIKCSICVDFFHFRTGKVQQKEKDAYEEREVTGVTGLQSSFGGLSFKQPSTKPGDLFHFSGLIRNTVTAIDFAL